MDLPKAVQGVSETVRWPEFTWLEFCNEEWNKYFYISQKMILITCLEEYISVDVIYRQALAITLENGIERKTLLCVYVAALCLNGAKKERELWQTGYSKSTLIQYENSLDNY